ncbi:nitrate reductase [Falsiruegeria mediterranea]|uniref:Nitrate reductase n=1 Tax=Falsiruegeria mediterranea M17 TaxID=1200281 RepID=A0A2R8CEX5_9RHOB|nr:nitrate reductase [Falsiruegeria mediterranea]SPJ30950.1 Nitrate reductase [Falsiruegeria mediterranea M17]
MTQTCTTCPYCGVGCGVLAGPDGEIVGDPNHPSNFGKLCSKGSALGETIGLDGRLLRPRIQGVDATWNQALDLVADKFRAAIKEHGPDSVAFYASGQLLTEDYYVANKLMKGYIGAANIDTNSRLCMASSVAGHKRAFGTDTVPGIYADWEQADLVVLVGTNLAWCHPVLYQRLLAEKTRRPQMRVVVIDPRRTATCDIADLHIPVQSDGDVALFNRLLTHLVDVGCVDTEYVAAHVDGFAATLSAARRSSLEAIGVDPDRITEFFRLFARTENVVTVYSQGVNQSVCGTDKVNAILNCHLITGRIGRPGMGPFSVTGQPNAMGGREVGGLANMLACHLDIENPDHRAAVQDAWQSPTICSEPGLKAIDLFQACSEGKIKALWVMSTNPAVSVPDANRVADAIASVPFVVVSDILERTDTGDLAHVLLPAAGWGEKSGTVTNSERMISRQRPFLSAPGEARPDWEIIADVARRMGFDGFDYQNEAQIFREHAALSGLAKRFGRDFDISGLAGLTDLDYDLLQPVRWPVPQAGAHGGRFFADGAFFHDNGRAKMVPVEQPAPVVRSELTLNTGRIRDQWHTMTRTGRSARLSAHLAEPFVEIHPEDAMAHGLRDADLAEVATEHGNALLRVLISSNARKGSIFVPMHWTAQTCHAGRVNPLVAPATDPVSGQPASKDGAVSVKRADMAWFGFAVSLKPLSPTTAYAALAPSPLGWRAELADPTPPEDWSAMARIITGCTHSDAALLEDHSTGLIRVALHQAGRIEALFFAAKQPVAVARTHVAGLLGKDISTLAALAGRAGADQPDPGATVCACFDVGINTLRAEFANGAQTVPELCQRTGAGTNCGSCKPELATLIAAIPKPVAAE